MFYSEINFIFSDQGPLLKGGGDVGGEYPCKRVFGFLFVCLEADIPLRCNEAYKF